MYTRKRTYTRRIKTPEQALASLMNLASRAEKSSGDARRLMRLWGVEPEEAEKVLARLEELQFIDDERFARLYVREKMRVDGWGVYKLRAALAQKGISREIIAATLDEPEELDVETMNEKLQKNMERKMRQIKSDNKYEIRSKLIRYGLSRGHAYDKITAVVDKIMKSSELFFFALAAVVSSLLAPVSSNAQPVDYYRVPMEIPVALSANFGEIRVNRFHTGVDIKTQGVTGKELTAAADGYIARISVAPTGYGRALYIAHPNGTTTVYAHLERFTSEVEDYLRGERKRLKRSDIDLYPPASRFPLKQGDPIGLSGNSGASAGPHLHFEVRQSSSSRTLNAVARGWIKPAVKDNVPPRIVKLYHIDIDTIAGVPIHSRPRAYDVVRNADGSYSLAGGAGSGGTKSGTATARTTPLKAGVGSYFVVEATDRRPDVTNTFGIYRASLSVDGIETLVFEKDGVLFDEVRYACASVLYSVQRATRNEAVMLAVKGGNRLGMYKKALGGGVLRVLPDQAPREVEISVEDDSQNIATLRFTVTADGNRTPPVKPEGRLASDRMDFLNYFDGLAINIPRGALYEPIFYTQIAVDQSIKPRSDSIRPLSRLHRLGDGIMPLHKAAKIAIAADVPEPLRARAVLAKVADNGTLAWAGGRWENASVTGSVRDFGTYCVVADTTPPTASSNFSSGADLSKSAGFTLTARDNFSGIASFTGSIDGEWIIFERTASRGQFFHRFDTAATASGTATGAAGSATGAVHTLEFTVRDGAGNQTTIRRTFTR